MQQEQAQVTASADPSVVSSAPTFSQESAPSTSASSSYPSTSAAPQTSPELVSLLEYSRAQGVDLPYQDDSQAYTALIQAYQQLPHLQHLARYGSEYLQSLDARGRPRVSFPSVPGDVGTSGGTTTPKSWWSPPASREEVQRLVGQWYTRDAKGELGPRPETPPSVLQKIADYSTYVDGFREKFFANPQEALRDAIQEEASKLFQNQMRAYRSNENAVDVIKRHQNWMFYSDPQTGTLIIDPSTGSPRYTPEGIAFYNYVVQLDQAGIKDSYQIEQHALAMLERDRYRQQIAAWNYRIQATQPQQAYGQQSMPPAGSRIASYTTNGQGVPYGAGSLAALLRQEMAAQGVTSTD